MHFFVLFSLSFFRSSVDLNPLPLPHSSSSIITTTTTTTNKQPTGRLPHLLAPPAPVGLPRLPPRRPPLLARGGLRGRSRRRLRRDPAPERRRLRRPVRLDGPRRRRRRRRPRGHGAGVAPPAGGGLRRGGVGGEGREEARWRWRWRWRWRSGRELAFASVGGAVCFFGRRRRRRRGGGGGRARRKAPVVLFPPEKAESLPLRRLRRPLLHGRAPGDPLSPPGEEGLVPNGVGCRGREGGRRSSGGGGDDDDGRGGDAAGALDILKRERENTFFFPFCTALRHICTTFT